MFVAPVLVEFPLLVRFIEDKLDPDHVYNCVLLE